jgi:hypothetical protein
MSFQQKYNKYKNKYLNLKNQIGSSSSAKSFSPFYFSVYTFTREPLDEIRKNKMIELLKSIYGGEIIVLTDLSELSDPIKQGNWFNAQEYIEAKSIYGDLTYITEFQIDNVPKILKTDMDDSKLTAQEHAIGSSDILNRFDLNTLSLPVIKGNAFSRGWGFWGPSVAAVTLVEKN